MSGPRSAGRNNKSNTSSGGGAATHAGTDFQDRLAIWIAVRILDEQNVSPPWELAPATTLE